MEGVQSFEQRSASDWDGARGNRVIIVNRRDPNLRWLNTTNATTNEIDYKTLKTTTQAPSNDYNRAASGTSCGLGRQCSRLASSCFRHCTCGEELERSNSRGRAKRRLSEAPSTVSNGSHGSQSLSSSIHNFDFGPFATNRLTTSKYTLINFLPKNLFEQFRRLANFYFLVTALLQIVLPFSPVGPSTSLVPLFFVVATTAVKQAYEDYLRHKLDNQVNERPCLILREGDKSLTEACSRDIRVGDIVYVRNNEEIPCDMVLLASSGAGDRCYITTANLDGETSLKSRTCFQIRQQIGSMEQLNESLLVIECEKPNATLYEFNGFLRAPKDARAYEALMKDVGFLDELKMAPDGGGQASGGRSTESQAIVSNQLRMKRNSVIATIFKRMKQAQFHSRIAKHLAIEQQKQMRLSGGSSNSLAERLVDCAAGEHVEIPLDISNLLLRASRLRNTSHIYGLAVYTGEDTRLAHNSHVKPNKFSSLETRVNMFLGIAFGILFILSLISSLLHDHPGHSTIRAASENGTIADTGRQRKPESFFELFAAQFMLYNYLVPISLYVTLEFVKFLGTIAVLEDKKLQATVYSNPSMSPGGAGHTSDLGAAPKNVPQSPSSRSNDKNATTSKNIVGPQCNSSDLNEDLGQVEVLFSDKTGTLTENKMYFKACSIGGRLYRTISNQLYEQPDGLCHVPALNVAKKLGRIKGNRYAAIASELNEHHGPRSAPRNSLSVGSRSSKSSLDQLAKLPAQQRPFDHRVFPSQRDMQLMDSLEQCPNVVEFFLCLCLCSTISINEQLTIEECLKDQLLERNDYQSASPDEESLIEAAAQFGIIICKSSERECYLAIRRKAPHNSPSAPAATGSPTTANVRRKQPKSAGDKKTKSRSGPLTNGANESEETAPHNFKSICETKLSNDKFFVRHFERLLTFEFNSTRKKMSVLYRDCDNDCLLLITKGSESVLDCIAISEHVKPPIERSIDSVLAHFEAFSKSGLRTMLVARRFLDKLEYERVLGEMREARLMSTHENRNEKLAGLYKQVESHMTLVGATAVEDCLQNGVPETIADLREAGIKVWLLTGDKVETAISVAYLCKLLDRNMNLLSLIRQQDSRACKELLKSFVERIKRAMVFGDDEEREHDELVASTSFHQSSSKLKSLSGQQQRSLSLTTAIANSKQARASASGSGGSSANKPAVSNSPRRGRTIIASELDLPRFALVADGRSLHYAMKHSRRELEFISNHCVCVLGCRLSPLQKAEIVDLIKNGEQEPITAAIGDGANDVSMIQEAHVGIGISGKEGRQAVNSSDFAVNRFHMLNRLFFVHGHLFYHRTANTIQYFFYKSFLFIIPQFVYSFYNLSTATSLYHPTMLMSYNMAFTSVPILLYGLSEVSIPESLLETRPRLYRINRRNVKMRYRVFISWLLLGSIQGIIAFYSVFLIWGNHTSFLDPGNVSGRLGLSLALFFAIVVLATVKLFFLSKKRSWFFDIASILSCCMLPVIFWGLNLVNLSGLIQDNQLQGQVAVHFKTPMFWLSTLGAIAAAVIPDLMLFIRDRIAYKRLINSVMNPS